MVKLSLYYISVLWLRHAVFVCCERYFNYSLQNNMRGVALLKYVVPKDMFGYQLISLISTGFVTGA